MVAGDLHYVLLNHLEAWENRSADVLESVARPLAAAGIVACLGGAVAALVMAAAENGTMPTRLRRLLDGWLIASCLLALGRVLLLHQADPMTDSSVSLLELSRAVADIVVLGLLVALRFCRSQTERKAATVAALALALLTVSDSLRIVAPHPDASPNLTAATACSVTGLLLVAVSPWLPGGVSAVGFDQRTMPVIGVVAAFVPLAVSGLAIAAQAAVDGSVDGVLMCLSASMLLALAIRQGATHADHLRITQETTAREDHYRTLVDGTSDVITIVSLDGRVLYVSPACLQVFGYQPGEFVGSRMPLICHPEDIETLMRAIATVREEAASDMRGRSHRVSCRVRDADGRWRHVESTISHHPQGMIFIIRDVSDRVARQAQLEHLAFHDALTGLPNRALFTDRVAHALRKRIAGAAPPVVLFLDLDGFKAVNDTAGHATGDALLAHAAQRLLASVRAGDTVARLGGDEFAALLEWDTETDHLSAWDIAQRILATLAQPYRLGSTEARVSASVGMAVASLGVTPQELLHRADLAMYEAKAAGKGRIRMHAHDTLVYENTVADGYRTPERQQPMPHGCVDETDVADPGPLRSAGALTSRHC
ncbi:diguanylate cyclase domain-containing protein [Streptomyces sp. NPDC101152]|uniref:diguanylate cyclase domain-containing protein n=1 Tax=Streptomyces sp. NPDC101152 TaxID=3366116 RepID=UPI0037F911EE